MTTARDLREPYRNYLASVILFHFAAAERSGLGLTDYQASSLLDLDKRMTNGQLAARLGLSAGATTRVVDRLIDFGLARRVVDPADRRRVMIEHTGELPEELASLLGPIRRQIGELVAALSEDQVDGLRSYFVGAAEIYGAAARNPERPGKDTP
ncbi:MarR family transcriptional regulator [Spiractinospora alimapuensis]|uniref:MarR family winged helix-turn-helix transcriptional regulator n=1 Tax=Spiractinospora alimapuensis TaxID=2820884 RepID=UPI001F16CAD6|nr:MarR family transcriptional regulator [Spiractinospora alimapuensis]QVQ50888.1 MarR family transcriptional regulator [Spiractinospora alimapuensis]